MSITEINCAMLIINKLIIHDIPKHRKGEDGSPNYSEAESVISDQLRLFFQDKIKEALHKVQAIRICYKEELSAAANKTREIIASDSDFIEHSKFLASELFRIQKGNNAAGILLIMRGHIKDSSICCILKLERDHGAQINFNDSTKSFDVHSVENLLLTKKSKVFKVLLLVDRCNCNVDYDGYLIDYQSDMKHKKGISSFFLDFIGCVPYDDPKISTKNFYNYTRSFIENVEDPLLQSKYIQDLNSYLQKNQTSFSPQEFASDYLNSPAEQDAYRQFLISKDFGFNTYTKDNSLIENKVKKFSIEFENGISIHGNKGDLGSNVQLSKAENDMYKATITSKITVVR